MSRTASTARSASVLFACIFTGNAAQAADPTWSFAYTGFNVSYTDHEGTSTSFDPLSTISGTFSGRDLDGNGALEEAELSAFQVDYTSYVPCNVSPYWSCHSPDFSFSPEGGLHFKTYVRSQDPEGFFTWTTAIQSGEFYDRRQDSWPPFAYVLRLEWTPQTTFVLTSPVPEPGILPLFGAGCVLLAALAGRRRAMHAHHTTFGRNQC